MRSSPWVPTGSSTAAESLGFAAAASLHAGLDVARARLAADDASVLRTQMEIARIPAPTGDEAQRAAWVARRFTQLGLDEVNVDASGNVRGRRRGLGHEHAPVVVCAHLDTVFPRSTPQAFRRDGNRIVGPGIGDNARGLAAMLSLAAVIDGRRVATYRSVEFVATVGEEGAGDLRGMKHLFATTSREREPAAVIVLDGPGDDRIVHRALGARRFRLEFRGPGGHSWAAFGAPNAVHAAAITAARLAAVALPHEPRTTLTVARIGGGTAVNVIPDTAWLEVDLRSTATAMLDRHEHELRRVAALVCDETNARRAPGTDALTHAVEIIGDRPCGVLPAEHPLVALARDATRVVGRTPELATASTDANVPIALGIPAIAIGAGGRGGGAHTVDEWYVNDEGTRGIARALVIVVAVAGRA